ncbi:L domain-like protein [Rhizoclosmatium globosum]|uniref:L domain-like protein n=1 Tax=Rhizoclosmatium globosum TaxID=329046 RepID=A0A1Y2D1K1_9FUNG|nr:L domain-like protein [Rhizoclosmatium globosum]|eukprot:ORY53130.1 L domain-like protein [Rhizoclosmatium globosum]
MADDDPDATDQPAAEEVTEIEADAAAGAGDEPAEDGGDAAAPTDAPPPCEGEEPVPPPVDEDDKPVEDSEVLTSEMVGQHISLLARTGNGLSHAYTRLEIHSKNLTNIDVLENYLHLRYIDLAENAISDISALSSLEYLLSIDFHANKIKKIPASMDKRKYLQQANFAKNMIESIDVTDWPMIAWLNLNENKLSEVRLPEFGELIHLEARGNKITTTRGINARKLERLYLGGNQIKALDLDDKPNLQILHVRDNQIVSLDGLNESLNHSTINNLVETLDDIWRLGT